MNVLQRFNLKEQQRLKDLELKQEKERVRLAEQAILEQDSLTFHPEILPHSRDLNKGRTRTPEQYYRDALDYRQQKHSIALQEKQERECLQELNFTPKTNQKSISMIKQGFFDRLEEKQAVKQLNLKIIEKAITPSFTPQLNNYRSRSITPTKKQHINEDVVKKPQKSFQLFEEVRKNTATNPEENAKKQIILLSACKYQTPTKKETTPKRRGYTPIVQKYQNAKLETTQSEIEHSSIKKNYFNI